MSPQRRTALVSVGAACVLIAIKLAAGLGSSSLAALGEAVFLVGVSLVIAGIAVARIAGAVAFSVDATWWTFGAVALVIAIDSSRLLTSFRTAQRYSSEALLASSLHFGSDLAGTLAVLAGLSAAALGFPEGDAIAALFVGVLVVAAAVQLLRRNVSVLMDQAPAEAERAARRSAFASARSRPHSRFHRCARSTTSRCSRSMAGRRCPSI